MSAINLFKSGASTIYKAASNCAKLLPSRSCIRTSVKAASVALIVFSLLESATSEDVYHLNYFSKCNSNHTFSDEGGNVFDLNFQNEPWVCRPDHQMSNKPNIRLNCLVSSLWYDNVSYSSIIGRIVEQFNSYAYCLHTENKLVVIGSGLKMLSDRIIFSLALNLPKTGNNWNKFENAF